MFFCFCFSDKGRPIHSHQDKARAALQLAYMDNYGNMGCGVFKQGVQNWKHFCLKINILKGNDLIFRIGVMHGEVSRIWHNLKWF